jgi:hypothetical protein
LSTAVEGAGQLCATEGAVGQRATVFAGKWDSLGNALIDDVVGDLSKAVNICFAGSIVTALDGVVKQPPDAVAVVGVVFGGVDTTLSSDGVGATL